MSCPTRSGDDDDDDDDDVIGAINLTVVLVLRDMESFHMLSRSPTLCASLLLFLTRSDSAFDDGMGLVLLLLLLVLLHSALSTLSGRVDAAGVTASRSDDAVSVLLSSD
jgi:hypothetical protein